MGASPGLMLFWSDRKLTLTKSGCVCQTILNDVFRQTVSSVTQSLKFATLNPKSASWPKVALQRASGRTGLGGGLSLTWPPWSFAEGANNLAWLVSSAGSSAPLFGAFT